jgi:hypothetical protein
MSVIYVVYDWNTGEIFQRLTVSDEKQAAIYQNKLEITVAEADAKPEVYKRVDLATMTLVDK